MAPSSGTTATASRSLVTAVRIFSSISTALSTCLRMGKRQRTADRTAKTGTANRRVKRLRSGLFLAVEECARGGLAFASCPVPRLPIGLKRPDEERHQRLSDQPAALIAKFAGDH